MGCVRKGYYQYFIECVHYTHHPWYKNRKAIQQLDKEATELGRRWVPGQQPLEECDSVARTWALEADRFDLNNDSSTY